MRAGGATEYRGEGTVEGGKQGGHAKFLALWKKEGEELFELERQLHVGNLKKGLSNQKWNFTKYMKDSPEAAGMPEVELAFDLGMLADAGLDTSTVALDWFTIAWITSGSRGWVKKAQQLLDEVVGKHRLPIFEDCPRLAYIDAIAEFHLSDSIMGKAWHYMT